MSIKSTFMDGKDQSRTRQCLALTPEGKFLHTTNVIIGHEDTLPDIKFNLFLSRLSVRKFIKSKKLEAPAAERNGQHVNELITNALRGQFVRLESNKFLLLELRKESKPRAERILVKSLELSKEFLAPLEIHFSHESSDSIL
jgi:hypothetical protein